MARLSGKIALVTGGTRGIGRAIVEAFLREGAAVAFSGRTDESVAAARAWLPKDAAAHPIAADLADREAPERLVAACVERFGGIDILVNNAGVVSRANEWELTPEEWDRIHDVNLRALFFLSREAARSMQSRGGGSIVNISSIAGQHGGIAGSPAYASSKAAVIGLTRSLARRFAQHGIRVNCIAPADIDTDMTANWPQELRRRLIDLTPLARFGRPDEVSGATVFLASDESSFVTGQTLSINGGAYMS
ncbi:MAG: 3-oxoacyl-ACP reductase FabG [Rhodospirillales bacterium]|nr:3-oxoacyl-ACP reductase FabG [Rhodospirillales bacterium]